MASGEPVILVPGLWMPAASLWCLGRRLARHGYGPVGFGYRWIGRDASDNGARLADFAGRLARRGSRVHLLGHSTGAVLLLRALADHPALVGRAGRVLMLGPPYAGCAAADTLLGWPGGPRLLGRTLRQWLGEPRPVPDPRVEVGVIAGTRSLGLGSWVARLSSPNDGVVRLEETQVPGAVARLELPIGHSEMLLSRRVASEAANFLRHGRFALDPAADRRVPGAPSRDP
ncbi:MAG: esterase/lipase family protein [Pseudomonadota bacterium]